jgi:hypothetical protein
MVLNRVGFAYAVCACLLLVLGAFQTATRDCCSSCRRVVGELSESGLCQSSPSPCLAGKGLAPKILMAAPVSALSGLLLPVASCVEPSVSCVQPSVPCLSNP